LLLKTGLKVINEQVSQSLKRIINILQDVCGIKQILCIDGLEDILLSFLRLLVLNDGVLALGHNGSDTKLQTIVGQSQCGFLASLL
jgi:hypothetical protein